MPHRASQSRTARARRAGVLGVLLLLSSSCSITRIAAGGLRDALGGFQETLAADSDPELVRDAMPFMMKTLEALVIKTPGDAELLLTTSQAFTSYSYAFVDSEASLVEWEDYTEFQRLRKRALGLYLRARDYGIRALETRHPGLGARLRKRPAETVAKLELEDVPALYWTAAAWGSAISIGLDRAELVADVDVVRAALRRCLELQPDYGGSAIHEAMLVIEALPELMGGSTERAREHYERALEASEGRSAGLFVSLAASVSVGSQDRGEFTELLERALAIDPDEDPRLRLVNHIAQRRARHLLDTADELFLEPLYEDPE